MSVLLLGLLGVAAQVSVGDAPGALAALGDHLPGESGSATVLRARLLHQLDRPEAADALLETVVDADLAVAVDWMRVQLRPNDPSAAWRLIPPADVPADVTWRHISSWRPRAPTSRRCRRSQVSRSWPRVPSCACTR